MATQSEKPRYNTARGEAELAQNPPFLFRDVTALVFPLKADQSVLSDLIDCYLNLLSPRIAEFRLAAPFVYLAVLHYGYMRGTDQPGQGWVSQNEVTFLVPVERWEKKRSGHATFVDLAWVSPYIFVDDELSLIGGREFYGWPKVPSQISYLGLQDLHPRHESQIVALHTTGFPLRSVGKKDQPQLLLTIGQAPPPSFSIVPSPLTDLSTFSSRIYSMTLDSFFGAWQGFDVLAPLWNSVYRCPPDIQTFGRMATKGRQDLRALLKALASSQIKRQSYPDTQALDSLITSLGRQDLRTLLKTLTSSQADSQSDLDTQTSDSSIISFDQITFKQFHDAESPQESACYQAVITSPLGISRFKRGGLLGDLDLLRGDPSGGFHITLYSEPLGRLIRDNLGLEVTAKRKVDGNSVFVLEPLLPFWSEMDLYYDYAKTLGWRIWNKENPDGTGWYRGPTKKGGIIKENPPTNSSTGQSNQSSSTSTGGPTINVFPDRMKNPIAYNYATGEDLEDTPPEKSRPVLLEIYPLKTDKEKGKTSPLEIFCQKYIEDLHPLLPKKDEIEPLYWFKPLGSYVYVIVINYKETKKTGTNLPEEEFWTPREVAFTIPVVWGQDPDKKKPINIALLAPFVFVETQNDAIIDREISGRPTMDATIEVPRTKLPPSPSLDVRYPLLTLKTEVVPHIHRNQQVIERSLLEIYQGDVLKNNADDEWEEIEKKWGQALLQDHEDKKKIKKTAGREFIDILAKIRSVLSGLPIYSLMLKQFRDIDDLTAACYQAIVSSGWVLETIEEVEEFPALQHLALWRYDSPAIVQTLGLTVKHTNHRDHICVDQLQPVRPFRMKVQLTEQTRQSVCWRAGDETWVGKEFGQNLLKGSEIDPSLLTRVYNMEELHALVEGLLSEDYLRAGSDPDSPQEKDNEQNGCHLFARYDSVGPRWNPRHLPKAFRQVEKSVWITEDERVPNP